MRNSILLIFLWTILLCSPNVFAATWQYKGIIAPSEATILKDYKAVYKMRDNSQQKRLRSKQPESISLPDLNGNEIEFVLHETATMNKVLATEFKKIRSFKGYSNDAFKYPLRIETDGERLHARYSTGIGTIVLESTTNGNYEASVEHLRALREFEDDIDPNDNIRTDLLPQPHITPKNLTTTRPVTRTLRLAVAATGEFTHFHHDDKQQAMLAIVSHVNRMNEIFERDIGVRFELIAGNSQLIFMDPATDPFTNTSLSMMREENQTLLDSVIQDINYDIGHVVGTRFGGMATPQSACETGSKAKGASGSENPVGDGFSIRVLSHEIAHQLGAMHSFNGTTGSCGGLNRVAQTAYEPGSGSTIMGYAGLCSSENLQNLPDAYFHHHSIWSIEKYFEWYRPDCGVLSEETTNIPVVTVPAEVTIPRLTPFQLVGSATDLDQNDTLTYNWEQMDLGPASPPSDDDGLRPILRSFLPSLEPARSYPRLFTLQTGHLLAGEVFPNSNRRMTFRLSARDGRGAVGFKDMFVQVTTAAGPFRVMPPKTTQPITKCSKLSVVWDVANTNQPPISCSHVEVFASADDGATWQTPSLGIVANTGSHVFDLGTVMSTNTGRIKVKCVNNIFFAISPTKLQIVNDQAMISCMDFESGTLPPGN